MSHRILFSTFLCTALPLGAGAALDRPWQQVTFPATADVAGAFHAPAPEYGAQFTWGWKGPVDEAAIVKDLDGIKALGVHAAIIDPGSRMHERYLSPGYFALVKFAVREAKKRDMRLWIMDDGDYPSGMAGGKLTAERPDLGMQGLATPERVAVAAGARFTRAAGPDLICAVAVDSTSGKTVVLEIKNGQIDWSAPAGTWEVIISRSVFRTSPTRAAYNETGAKDTTYSLVDYLNPAATQVYVNWTFEGYRQAIGDELGKTVLGFRGDEPAYAFNPWTPALLTEFRKKKGYDLRPYLAAFGAGYGSRQADLTAEQRRAYADYCDVWSDLFRDSYFSREGDWCKANGVEMQLHIEHEEVLPELATSNGDYFKVFENVEVPGIDTIWHQIWMDNPADFPKLASSAAHLNGHPRAMCEAFAAYRPPPNLTQATWILNFLLVHGINRIEYMFYPSAAQGSFRPPPLADAAPAAALPARPRPANDGGGSRYYRDPGFPAVAAYVDRLSYILGEGRPAAEIALLVPSASFWVGEPAAAKQINASFLQIAHALIGAQRDFDFVDERSLGAGLALEQGRFVNQSGQAYRAVIVPPSLVISGAALKRLRQFAEMGGRVIFIGGAPASVEVTTYLASQGKPDVGWASYVEPTAALTTDAVAQLPDPDVQLDQPQPSVSYLHRRLRDADLYFFFNSGTDPIDLHARVAGTGNVQKWDPATGTVAKLVGASVGPDRATVPLKLAAGETLLVTVGANGAPN